MGMNTPLVDLLREGLLWLTLLVELLGLVGCLYHLRLSFWVKAIALGFALLLLAGLWNRGMFFLFRWGMRDDLPLPLDVLFVLSSLGYLAGTTLVVLGLGLTFADARKQLDSLKIEIYRLSGDQPQPKW